MLLSDLEPPSEGVPARRRRVPSREHPEEGMPATAWLRLA